MRPRASKYFSFAFDGVNGVMVRGLDSPVQEDEVEAFGCWGWGGVRSVSP